MGVSEVMSGFHQLIQTAEPYMLMMCLGHFYDENPSQRSFPPRKHLLEKEFGRNLRSFEQGTSHL
jgi:hypothetical protein